MKKQKNQIQYPSEEISTIAELRSFDSKQIFKIIFYGFERDEDEWLKVDIEFQGNRTHYRRKSWEFDALALAKTLRYVRRFRGDIERSQTILWAPYRDQGISLQYKQGYNKSAWRRFPRGRQGIFAYGEFGDFSFSFKVDRSVLLKFEQSIECAVRNYPLKAEKSIRLLEGE